MFGGQAEHNTNRIDFKLLTEAAPAGFMARFMMVEKDRPRRSLDGEPAQPAAASTIAWAAISRSEARR